MLSKLKLSQRILLGYLAPLLLLLVAMTVVYINMRELAYSTAQHDRQQKIMLQIQEMTLNTVKMQRITRGYLLKRNPDWLIDFRESEINAKKSYEWLQQEVIDPQQKDTLHRMQNLITSLAEQQKVMIALVDEGKEAEAIALWRNENAIKNASELEELSTIFMQREEAISKETSAQQAADSSIVITSVIYGMLGAISLSVAIAFWLAAAISRNITASATQLSAASNEIAATIAQHERTASQQSVAVNETSATIEELSASSRQSAEQAANSAALAERSSTATTQGSEATQQAVMAMNSLKEKIGAMADQILHLGEQTAQIGSIATLLKDLAGQINMLALNAAVEAARAGEHGKGFAVVASEIRKLADQSKKSAEQTAILVADIQKATNASIMVTEDGTRTVGDVTQLVRQVSDLFNNLASLANGVNENAQQMMLNTKQQSAAFAQVVEATNSIAAGAKETVAGIGQTKIGVQNLNNAAENLKAIL